MNIHKVSIIRITLVDLDPSFSEGSSDIERVYRAFATSIRNYPSSRSAGSHPPMDIRVEVHVVNFGRVAQWNWFSNPDHGPESGRPGDSDPTALESHIFRQVHADLAQIGIPCCIELMSEVLQS